MCSEGSVLCINFTHHGSHCHQKNWFFVGWVEATAVQSTRHSGISIEVRKANTIKTCIRNWPMNRNFKTHENISDAKEDGQNKSEQKPNDQMIRT